MTQFSLFGNASEQGEKLLLPDADFVYYPEWLAAGEADTLFKHFQQTLSWHQSDIHIYGKTIPIPRLNAWYGDVGSSYQYSGAKFVPQALDAQLEGLRQKLQTLLGVKFNSVLANLYRDGQDGVSWHSDDEAELGRQPFIASVSLGAVRRFSLKHKMNDHLPTSHLDLPHGSLLVMAGDAQRCWQHQIAKTAKTVGPRINLTFRWVYGSQ